MKIVVIGGTGLIGAKTVNLLRQGGHDVVAASRKNGIDIVNHNAMRLYDAIADRSGFVQYRKNFA